MSEKDKFPSDAADRFQLRLPPGLRDRIKAYAERHGRSMNTEIVRVLEKEFPPPASIGERVDDLLALLPALKKLDDNAGIGNLIEGIHATLRDVASGRIKVESQQTRNEVRTLLHEWEHLQSENEFSRVAQFMDDEERVALERGDDPFRG